MQEMQEIFIFSSFGHLCSASHWQLPTQPGNERPTPWGHAQVRSAQCMHATTMDFTGKYWISSQKGQQMAQDTYQKQRWCLSLFIPPIIKIFSYLAGKIHQIQRKIYITWISEDYVDELIPRIQWKLFGDVPFHYAPASVSEKQDV